VRGGPDEETATDTARSRKVVEAFFRASREGDFQALLAVLDPNVTLRPDAAAFALGARTGWLTAEVRGAEAVAEQFAGQAQAAQLALIGGLPGGTWAPGGKPFVVFEFAIEDDRVVEIALVADPEQLRELDVEILD